MNFTVLGGSGFIGRRLVQYLREGGAPVYAPPRQESGDDLDSVLGHELGHVFYCIGLTADFRQRPFDTVETHVCLLRRLLQYGRFDSLTYLSSTRVYLGAASTREDEILPVQSGNADHLYNLSKLMGESLCLHSGRNARVVRLSNVYGPDFGSGNFLSAVLREAAATGRVLFQTAAASAKDYVALDDVVRWLPEIATRGRERIYNLASGSNVSNQEIAAALEQAGVQVEFASDAPVWTFPVIETARVRTEFGAAQRDLPHDLAGLLDEFRNCR